MYNSCIVSYFSDWFFGYFCCYIFFSSISLFTESIVILKNLTGKKESVISRVVALLELNLN